MNDKKRIKRNDLKIYIKFGVVMLICLMGGFFSGRVFFYLQERIDSIDWVEIAQKLYMFSSIAFMILVIVVYGISYMIYASAKNKYSEISVLDDEAFEDGIYVVERTLSRALLVATFIFILSFLCFPFVTLCSETLKNAGMEVVKVGIIIAMISFIGALVFYLMIASLVISLEKKINPEKNGNIFDVHFTKKWLGSMDEAELMKVAKASQKAYYAGVSTCMVLWVISLIAMLSFHTGILPIICITIVMMVMVITAEIQSR